MNVGKHLLIQVINIKDTFLLEKLENGRDVLLKIIQTCKLNVVNECGHQFTPKGYTFVYVLSESHFSIHTYPEHNMCYIDIFCCSKEFDEMSAVEAIRDGFKTDTVEWSVITR
jgi:S-adenosylmethionine decarboxylase proenzyme